MSKEEQLHQRILLVLGILGIVFYVVAPIAFPSAANLRQPELLPIYSLMIGLGRLIKTNGKKAKGDSSKKNDNEG